MPQNILILLLACFINSVDDLHLLDRGQPKPFTIHFQCRCKIRKSNSSDLYAVTRINIFPARLVFFTLRKMTWYFVKYVRLKAEHDLAWSFSFTKCHKNPTCQLALFINLSSSNIVTDYISIVVGTKRGLWCLGRSQSTGRTSY